jgi:hypothetical protein
MDASVIVCTYNRAESLRDTLRALKTQQPVAGREWEVIVQDGFSMLPALLPIPMHKLLTGEFENSLDKTSQNVESRK